MYGAFLPLFSQVGGLLTARGTPSWPGLRENIWQHPQLLCPVNVYLALWAKFMMTEDAFYWGLMPKNFAF